MKISAGESPLLLTLALAAAVVVSAMALVYTKHESRKLFVELEQLNHRRDELNIDWGRLQLEQSTWATHGRIEQVARDDLALIRPKTEEMFVIERIVTERK